MSFSKNLFNYSKQLTCWESFSVLQGDPSSTQRFHTLLLLGAEVEIYFDKGIIHYQVKSGSISDIEKALLEALASYIKKIHKVPSLRELDFFLRDVPSFPSWPTTFNCEFLDKAMLFFEQCLNQQVDSPVDWIKHKLENFKGVTYDILNEKDDVIILKGSKTDAWVVEKNFDEWQKQIRIIFNRPHLLLLYAINS